MHIRSVTQIQPMKAQLDSDSLMSLLDKVQALAATVVAVSDAVAVFDKGDAVA